MWRRCWRTRWLDACARPSLPVLFVKRWKHLMTLEHTSRKSVSVLQKNSLPACFFYCGWNKVVVMQCHDGKIDKREQSGLMQYPQHGAWIQMTHSKRCTGLTSSFSKFKKNLRFKCLPFSSWKLTKAVLLHSNCGYEGLCRTHLRVLSSVVHTDIN